MNRIHAPIRTESLAVAAPTTSPLLGPAGRLVVVVPDVAEAGLLAGRIIEVARSRGSSVLLLGVASDLVSESELRRKLALLSAFVRDAGTEVEIRMEHGLNWIHGFRFLLGDRDLLACCGENVLPAGGRPWGEMLSSQLRRPVYVFEESSFSATPGASVLGRFAPWLGSIAIILGFLWLQVQVSQYGGNATDTALLVASVPIEVALIWLCNSMFA